MEPERRWILTYDYVEGIVDKRAPHRPAHLGYAEEAVRAGKLLAGGAVGDPPTRGVLVFRADDPAEIEAFAQADPYVRNGLVTDWRVEPWLVVVGG